MCRILLSFLIVFAVSLSAYGQSISRGPYLQVLSPESIQICWRTDIPANSRIIYGTTLNAQEQEVIDLNSKTDHFITIPNLEPGTTYYYSIGTTDSLLAASSQALRFTTSPSAANTDKFSFWAIGDFGKASQGQIDVMNSFIQYDQEAQTDFMLMLGDNAYQDGTQAEFQSKLFDVYDSILTYIPIYSTPGNHDYNSVNRLAPPAEHVGPYYDIFKSPILGEAGGTPSNTKLYYSFDYGNAHFISLNSEIQAWTLDDNSPMYQWLEADLQANTKEWVICFFHQPPYSKGSHDSDDFWELLMSAMRQNALPILEQYGVDLVLNGHSHVYERSKLIKGHYGFSFSFNNNTHAINSGNGNFEQGEHYIKYQNSGNEGTVYVVCGNSGSKEDDPDLDHPVMVSSYGGSNAYGSLIVEIEGNRLDGKYLKSDGTLFDHFTIIKPDLEDPLLHEKPNGLYASTVSLYPNPFENTFNLRFHLDKARQVELRIFDTGGKEVFRDSFKGKKHENIYTGNLASLQTGNYLVSLHVGNQVQTKHLTKK